MFRSRSTVLVWLMCAVLLVMRVGSVHVHLCADGNEPASSLHVGDIGIDDQNHPKGVGGESSVSDSDVSVPGTALVSSLDGDFDLPALAFTFTLILFVVVVVRSIRPDWRAELVPISGPADFRPPLRGPPA